MEFNHPVSLIIAWFPPKAGYSGSKLLIDAFTVRWKHYKFVHSRDKAACVERQLAVESNFLFEL